MTSVKVYLKNIETNEATCERTFADIYESEMYYSALLILARVTNFPGLPCRE